MKNQGRTRQQLIAENEELRGQVAALEKAFQGNQWAAALLQVAPLGIHECDSEGRITFVNPSQEAITGYTADELVGTCIWDYFEPGPKKDTLTAYLAHLVSKQPAPTSFFAKIIRKNGEVFDVRLDWNYKRSQQGEVNGFVCILTDISEAKRAEQALRESEGRYRALAESTRDIIYILDRQGTLLYANQAASRCIGIESNDLIGKRQVDLFPPEMAQAHIEQTKQVFATGELIEYDRLFHFGPEEVWLRVHLLPLRDEAGQVTSVMGVCHNITDRRRTEETLREREKTFRSLFQDSSVGAAVVSPNGAFLRVNRALFEFLGYSEQELLRKTVFSITHPDDQAETSKVIHQEAHTVLDPHRLEKRYLHKSGRVLWGELNATLLCDAEGKPSYFIAQVLDVGRRKQAEQALQKARDELERRVEERTAALQNANEELDIFHRLAEASGQGFCMVDMNDRITYMNPAFSRMVGVASPEHVTGEHLTTLYPEGYLSKRKTEIIPAIVRDGYWEGELAISPAGRTINIFQNSFLIKDKNGTPTRIASVITDITERKLAEEALRQSEKRFRSYFEQGLIGMAVSLPDRRWIQVNDRYCDMLGYSRDELLTMKWTDLTHPDDMERNLAPESHLLAGEIEHNTIDKRFLRKDGSIMHATVFARCFRRQDGSADHFLSLILDITERKRAQEALERERRSLWRMLDSSIHERKTISYEIHDGIAQYLAAANMQLQSHDALRKSSPGEAKKAYKAAVKLVRQAYAESRRLINEVRPPLLDEVGLKTAIFHLVYEQRRFGATKIGFDSNVQFSRLPAVLENALYRITQEALANACKHSKSEQVAITMTQEGQDLRLEVRDWGIGFDPQSVEKGHFGLEGIRQRTRLLGGQLSVASKPGCGTRIQVVVPIVERQTKNKEDSQPDW
jgi:two-component system sensor histidine kinase UhpB